MSNLEAVRPVSTALGNGMSLNVNSLLHMIQMVSSQTQTREIGCQTGMIYSTCKMEPTQGNFVSGMIDFAQSVNPRCEATGNLEIKVDITGLPNVDNIIQHGFHIHELGDLSNGCASTGGHYNPFGGEHGGPTSERRHYGDLGNVEEDIYGNIKTTLVDQVASLTGTYSIVGRAVVLHANADDLGKGGNAGSTTSGNAGSRLGCCVIGHSDGSRWLGQAQLSKLTMNQRPTRIIHANLGVGR